LSIPRVTRDTPVAHDGSIMSIETIWLGIGFLGQGMFFGRWVIQWIASERKAESQVPISFWYMSLIGGLITLAYAIYRKDPVFIAGQSIGSIVYIRNLMLIFRASQTNRPVSPSNPRT
jgi:lipid-A-disaccharide synthase-like uncharacterized protein